MNAKGKTSINKNKVRTSASTLMRLAGISALLVGVCLIAIGIGHPANVPESVITSSWVNVHIFASALGIFGPFAMAGLYLRQAARSRWLSLAGSVFFSIWTILVSGISFVEAFILPRMATASPELVTGFLGMFTKVPSQIDLGILPTLVKIADPMYLLGLLLFGIATFRAGVLPRWAGALLVVGGLLAPVALLLPPDHQAMVMIPNGLAFIWMGYALFAERSAKTSESLHDQATIKAEPSNAA